MPLAPNATYADVAAVVRRHGKSCLQRIAAPRFRPRYVPVEQVLPHEHQQTDLRPGTQDCPVCHKPVFNAAVVMDAPVFERPLWSWTKACYLYCCKEVHVRVFTCSRDGAIPGSLVRTGTLKGKAADAWLAKHPQAAQVADAVQ